MKTGTRECFGTDAAPAPLLAEIRMVGWDRFRSAADTVLGAHQHLGAFEVCYIADGSVDWWAEGDTYTLRRGDLYVTQPGERHGGVHSVMQPCELYWTQVDANTLPDALCRGLETLPRRVFAGSPVLPALYEALLAEHRAPTPLSPLAARAALHTLLVCVLRDAVRPATGDATAYTPPVAAALRRLSADLCAPLSVEQTAREVGLSAPRFVERFLSETGETPGEWRTRRRLLAARDALRKPGATVTETAFRWGFASSQYFATAFKRQFGLSPSQWRRVAGGSEAEPPSL